MLQRSYSLTNSQALQIANRMKFVEYDQRAHRLESLANFAFWVQSKQHHHLL